MKLRCRSTFINIEELMEQPPARRAVSDSFALKFEESVGSDYFDQLSEKLASVSSTRGVADFFGIAYTDRFAQSLDVSEISTTAPHCDASPALVTDDSMQRAQGAIQQVGQNYRDIAAAGLPTELCAQVATQVGINTSVADMLLQVKADALQDTQVLPTACSVSRGSTGHPELCNRPCVHLAQGGCELDRTCDYCHLEHPKRPVHLDKRHRELLRDVSPKIWVPVLLPVLQEKVNEFSPTREVQAMLESLSSTCLSHPWAPVSPGSDLPSRTRRTLAATLRSMTFKAILSTLQRSLRLHGLEVGFVSDKLMHTLRDQVSQRTPVFAV